MNITNSNTTTMKILTTLITMTCMSPAWTRVLPQYRVEACLLEFLFYHAPTDTCWPALERGPCAGDQWLVTSPAQRLASSTLAPKPPPHRFHQVFLSTVKTTLAGHPRPLTQWT